MEEDKNKLDQADVSVTRGSYTANLLGNIRGHLAGLQGYDIMALELIQNADDAKAHGVAFDITDDALVVWNSGAFTYCGEMSPVCRLMQEDNYSCDFHRIADVGSGGKLAKSENIGRFGIGFVSAYQVTDHPEIHSSGIKLQLIPEEAQYACSNIPLETGTKFVLPWAMNPHSIGRRAIGATPVRAGDIDQLQLEVLAVLRRSLLFLRHIETTEVRRNGKLLLRCELNRSDDSSLTITYSPEHSVERWHIIRGDAEQEAERLAKEYDLLKSLNRSSKFAIALNLDPDYQDKGLLYAFLPTEQNTGLPLHINADFFPEADRKALIFSGTQHARYWNEMLISAAAAELARNPESLGRLIGEEALWRIIHQAFQIASRDSDYPACFKAFWKQFNGTVPACKVAIDTNGELHVPSEIFLPSSTRFSDGQLSALNRLGANVVSEKLSPYRNTLSKIGVPTLRLDPLIAILRANLCNITGESCRTTEEMLKQFWVPLWSIIEELMPANFFKNRLVDQLKTLRFLVTEGLYTVSAADAYQCSRIINASLAARLFPKMFICSRHIADHPNISKLVADLDLQAVTNHLSKQISRHDLEYCINIEADALKDIYDFFPEIDNLGYSSNQVYKALSNLPIWSSSQGLIKASSALLPGNFEDPTGKGALLNTSVLTATAKQFISEKLGVKTQSISAFVETMLPTFFDSSGPLDESRYSILIRELSNHPELLDHTNAFKTLQSLPILPTQGGGWSEPASVYARTEQLENVLGNDDHLWLDFSKLPVAQSVKSFVDALGVLHSPAPIHLVQRLKNLAEAHHPDETVKKLSAEAFYTLCEVVHGQAGTETLSEAVSKLKAARCLPAKNDEKNWYYPVDLYTPFRSEGFESQAHILDFRNTNRLNTELLEDIGVKLKAPTELVVSHLQHCMENGTPPHETCYRILSERAKDDSEVTKLRGTSCIYVEKLQAFVKPSKIYWSQQQLGRFAYRVPPNLEHFTNFFNVVGVKDSPDVDELVEILLEIIAEFFEQSKPLTGADRAVYQSCLHHLAEAFTQGSLEQHNLVQLQKAPCILNFDDYFVHPDEVLLHDSEWLAKFFDGNMDQGLCKLDPELWIFADALGVKRLSRACHLKLDKIVGEKLPEQEVSKTLGNRARVILRLFHDKPRTIQERITPTLFNLSVYSTDNTFLQAIAVIDSQEIHAPVCSANAFFDQETNELLVTRPISNASWAPILTSLLHHLMPEESGSAISNLTLSLYSLLNMSPEVADTHLTSCGIPPLPENEEVDGYDLSTQELGELGHNSTENEPVEGSMNNFSDEPACEAHSGSEDEPTKTEPGSDTTSVTRFNSESNLATKEPGNSDSTAHNGQDRSSGSDNKPKRRSKHKEQWDKRLLSYVKRRDPSNDDTSATGDGNEHNLGVEVIARQAVCDFEKRRGRVPTQMPQTHPGYDIESLDTETGESRMIEVKGVNGEWNQTGVGLSGLQFDYAKKYNDSYWLYVIEFAADPDNIRVHPIQNPASQVTSFMFDGNWRGAAL
ncbi:DUF3883 domain-containing protein [Marinobacter sp. ELB17]|uniref:DUF3883 domain-containing protein n=1 Tax=Marinobacter sp. ELB17 TaxID=270374 RepID=UPI0000F39AA2|nr:DUF3883 domain-containing protein [Marinobacter sp. ELB17]EAZ98517.1 hypothetical protein MELB17_00250 [Marinobacter sp. ELB17]